MIKAALTLLSKRGRSWFPFMEAELEIGNAFHMFMLFKDKKVNE
jgi:hypothetical protein